MVVGPPIEEEDARTGLERVLAGLRAVIRRQRERFGPIEQGAAKEPEEAPEQS